MENEKVKLLGAMIQKLLDANTIEEILEITGSVCQLYVDAYIKPLLKGKEHLLVPLKFDGEIAEESDLIEVAEYNNGDKAVYVHLGNIITTGDLEYKKSFVMLILETLGHEYEHNIQTLYKSAMLGAGNGLVDGIKSLDPIVQDMLFKILQQKGLPLEEIKKVFDIYESRELIEKAIGENANEELVRGYNVDGVRMEEAASMFDFYPELLNDVAKLLPDLDEQGIKSACAFAVYYNALVEVDAREKGDEIFKNFIGDMNALLAGDDAVIFNRYASMVNRFHLETAKENLRGAVALLKANEVYKKMDVADFAKLGFVLEKASLDCDFTGYQFSSERYGEMKQKFKQLIGMLIRKNDCDETEAMHVLKTLKTMFVEHGLDNADFAVDEFAVENGFGEILSNQEFFELLKSGQITQRSFSKVEQLGNLQINELLVKYISEGKLDFASAMAASLPYARQLALMEASSDARAAMDRTEEEERRKAEAEAERRRAENPDDVFGMLSIEEPTPEKKDKIVIPQGEGILAALKARMAKLNEMKEAGTLVYDDVHDMLNLLADLCRIANVEYFFPSMMPKKKQNETPNAEVKRILLSLYVEAENLGRAMVVEKLGYEPLADAYRWAHPSDRRDYLLPEEAREERIKAIYGENEYNRYVREREYQEELNKPLE